MAFSLSMVSEDSTSRVIISPSKGTLIWALVNNEEEPPPPPPPLATAALPQNSYVQNKGKGKKSTSPIWEDFDKLTKMENGREVRYGAKCKHCGKEYSTFSTGGNGHLSRHSVSNLFQF
jgi:hypothetical protein